MILNIAEKPEVAEKFIYLVFFKTKERIFLVCHFKNTLETLFCNTEDKQTKAKNWSKAEKTSAGYSSGLHWECLVSDVIGSR